MKLSLGVVEERYILIFFLPPFRFGIQALFSDTGEKMDERGTEPEPLLSPTFPLFDGLPKRAF